MSLEAGLYITEEDVADLIPPPAIPDSTLETGNSKLLLTPLHSRHGGPARAWLCGECGDPTRTRRGMLSHLFLKHGIRRQLKLFV